MWSNYGEIKENKKKISDTLLRSFSELRCSLGKPDFREKRNFVHSSGMAWRSQKHEKNY